MDREEEDEWKMDWVSRDGPGCDLSIMKGKLENRSFWLFGGSKCGRDVVVVAVVARCWLRVWRNELEVERVEYGGTSMGNLPYTDGRYLPIGGSHEGARQAGYYTKQ